MADGVCADVDLVDDKVRKAGSLKGFIVPSIRVGITDDAVGIGETALCQLARKGSRLWPRVAFTT